MIGILLAERPEAFRRALETANEVASGIEAAKEADRAKAAAEAKIETGMSAWRTVTPDDEERPKSGSRRTSQRPDFTPDRPARK